MTKIKDFNPELLEIDKKSYKNIDIYYIGYVKFRWIHWRKNGDKYLTLVSTDKNKAVLIKYTELWGEIKNLIKKINNKRCNCDENYINIKFNSDDNLLLSKIIKLHNMAIVIRSVFQEDKKYYQQVFSDECLHKL